MKKSFEDIMKEGWIEVGTTKNFLGELVWYRNNGTKMLYNPFKESVIGIYPLTESEIKQERIFKSDADHPEIR